MTAIGFAVGLVLLVAGAELLVRGASRLAQAAGLSHLVIGLTVVAFGTSTPELAVSVKAALSAQADIALGNVVGSNTLNVLFILGISALISPLAVSQELVRRDVPVMIATSGLIWVLGAAGAIGRIEGLALLAGMVVYTAVLIRQGRRASPASSPAGRGPGTVKTIAASCVLVGVGLVLLVVGARWLVEGATGLARLLGVSELVIGLTVVAAGTSLPEAATSIVAALRGQRDIAVGNIVGSNVFNILAVLGASAAVAGGVRVAPAALHFDVPVMFAVAVACLPIFFTGGRISRAEGALFLAYYAAYVAYLVLAASHHEALSGFNWVMLWFALPATALGIGLSAAHALRGRKVTGDRPGR